MLLSEISSLYARSASGKALASLAKKNSVRRAAISGLTQSFVATLFSGLRTDMLFIMRDADEAGYLYQDFKNLQDSSVVFFPSSYKRAVKFGQRDAASAILRTEVLTRLASSEEDPLKIITYPAALSELVISQQDLDSRHIALRKGQEIPPTELEKQLKELGFQMQDYVYEPGQYAVRGSIIDIYSYSNDDPFRIDFFDNEIDTLRTFNVESQLSIEQLDKIDIVPEISRSQSPKIPFLNLLPDDTIIVTHNMGYVTDAIDYIYKDGFSKQALSDRLTAAPEADKAEIMRELTAELNLIRATEFEKNIKEFRWIELSAKTDESANISFSCQPQPLFHKNFELLAETINEY